MWVGEIFNSASVSEMELILQNITYLDQLVGEGRVLVTFSKYYSVFVSDTKASVADDSPTFIMYNMEAASGHIWKSESCWCPSTCSIYIVNKPKPLLSKKNIILFTHAAHSRISTLVIVTNTGDTPNGLTNGWDVDGANKLCSGEDVTSKFSVNLFM